MDSKGSGGKALQGNLKGSTAAKAKVIISEIYAISLKLGDIKNEAIKLQKRSSSGKAEWEEGGWEEVKKDEDLFLINNNLRVIVEDNTGWDLTYTRSSLYNVKKKDLNNILNFSIPFKLEIRKYQVDKPLKIKKDDNITAILKFLDLEEDISRIKGVRVKSGQDFIKTFNTKIKGSSKNDNCIQDLAPNLLGDRCRSSVGSGIRANRLLFNSKTGKSLSQDPLNPLENVVCVDANSWSDSTNKEDAIFCEINFRPPPILGDNYRIDVFLKDKNGNALKLKKDKYQTSKVTIWRKAKIDFILQGKNPADTSLYGKIKLDDVRKAYNDAYIVADCPKSSDSTRVHVISKDKWISYLDKFVYKGWRTSYWKKALKDEKVQIEQDLDLYSFPQNITLSKKKIEKKKVVTVSEPVKLFPSDSDKKHSSWDFIGKLSVVICKDFTKMNLSKTYSPKFCFYVLVCNRPSSDSTVGGQFQGCKLFYIVNCSDPTGTLVHEMGHALFLNHGYTKFVKLTSSSAVDYPIAINSVESGSEGPYFNEHDSEAIIPCVMSYENSYDVSANKVDWHFCGSCLLLLRFYDSGKLGKNADYQNLEYTLRKGGNIELAYANIISGVAPQEISVSSPLTIKLTKKSKLNRRELFVLYPKEGIKNNVGEDHFKDVSTYSRRIWKFTDPNTKANVPNNKRVISIGISKLPGDKRLTVIRAIRKGKNEISFGIKKADGTSVWSDPLTVEIS